jgi:tetratricopeptide (TPR) repeat protein
MRRQHVGPTQDPYITTAAVNHTARRDVKAIWRGANAVSANEIVSAALVGAGVIVSVVALIINNAVDKRAIANALKELAVKVNKRAAKYQLRNTDDAEQFRLSLEIQVLVQQAGYLMDRLHSECSEPVAVTLAEALELIREFWWADIYWRKATNAKDPYVRAKAFSYWGLALLGRGEWDRSAELIEEAVEAISPQSIDDYILRGDFYRTMAKWDRPQMGYWLAKAQTQYQNIRTSGHRYDMYMRLAEAPAGANAP